MRFQYQHSWLPGAAHLLTQSADKRLLRPRGLSLETYGTHRFFSKSAEVCRQEVCSTSVSPNRSVLIEHIPTSTFQRYAHIGLNQASVSQISASAIPDTLSRAYEYLDLVPSLRETVNQLVLCVHILRPHTASFDISHSDPALPFSVFLSVPRASLPNAALRACESLVHEAMHLQLTLLEHNTLYVFHDNPIRPSPWRPDLRPPRAILHGVYVFSVLHEFFNLLSSTLCRSDELRYVNRRRTQISTELQAALHWLQPGDLTDVGNHLRQFLTARGSLS